ncbi:MAG: glycine cleavage system aminomethyltransferase GcvT [Thaumarchaeota archaeon]|nr:glycine cleavage system aminomethyltransferase GcvT [Nitrososphaerota archaeon]
MARRSHLYEYHKINGKITEFSGFDMPLWYKGIIDEHMAVRTAAGLFDVSHMGRIWIRGNEATKYLSYLLPTNPSSIKDNRAFYSTICNYQGGIIDDVITNRFSEDLYMMVVNAGNRDKDLRWLKEIATKFDLALEDFSDESALIALQGPLSIQILQEICDTDLSQIRRFAFRDCKVSGEGAVVSRTGYTGEDGFEITLFDTPVDRPQKALKIWEEILAIGSKNGILPCGLGARDSLRLEAGMCLYGQDIDETTSPVEAALESVITVDGRDFVGKEKIDAQLKSGTVSKRVAFSMIEPGIPRHGYNVMFAGQKIGQVTSGTFSPVLRNGIGMGYVPSQISGLGQRISILMRDAEKYSEITQTPFYDSKKFGYKREISVSAQK